MVDCLLARPATGKTSYCVRTARDQIRREPFSTVWVITPGSYQSRYFRKRLTAEGGVFGVTVGTFINFSQTVLERAKVSAAIAPGSLNTAIIERVLRQVDEQAPLTYYAPIDDFPGFVKVLREAFNTLKTSNITPEAFLEVVESPQESELADLYRRYCDGSVSLGWEAHSAITARAAKMVTRDQALIEDVALVIVDGFDEFTEVELALLKAFAESGLKLLVTLPGEPGSKRAAHQKAMATLDKMSSHFEVNVIGLDAKPRLPDKIAEIEAYLFDRSEPFDSGSDEKNELPYFLECLSPEAEAREALRWIKQRVVRDGVPLNECAIFAASDTDHEKFIRPIAKEFKLPIYFFHRKTLIETPAGAALINLLRVPAEELDRDLLFRLLRSPYFSVALDELDLSALEAAARFGKVMKGRDQWRKTWENLERGYTEGFPEWLHWEEKHKLPTEQELGRLRSVIEGVLALFPDPDDERSYFEWACWLDGTLNNLHFYTLADKEERTLIKDTLEESFRVIQMGEKLFGKDQISYSQFASVLTTNLSTANVEDPNEVSNDAVFFASFIEARVSRYKAVCLIGLAEGAFPRREREDPFLREDLRQRLGIPTRAGADQFGIFYQAITRADEHLLITRPYMTDKGDKRHASPYWVETLNCFPNGTPRRINGAMKPDPRDLSSYEEALFHYPSAGFHEGDEVRDIKHGVTLINARADVDVPSIYDGSIEAISDRLRERFSSDKIWSSSAVEKFGRCAFDFYLSIVLGLKEVEEVEEDLNARQMGTIYHAILEELFRRYPDERDPEQMTQYLRLVADEVMATAPERFNFRPDNTWLVTKKEIVERLIDTIIALLEELHDWTPIEQEFEFGKKGKSEPASITLDDESILFRGYIDRIDQNQMGQLFVIDYKTSASIKNSGFEEGSALQFMVYAAAAEQLIGRNVLYSRYWNIRGAQFFGPKFDLEDENVDKQIDVFKIHLKNFLNKIRAGDLRPIPSTEKCSKYCPVLPFCYHADPEGGF